jgi:hypothetical protein
MPPEAKMPDELTGKGESADAPRLWLRAIREGWNIPDVVKKAAVSRAAQILADPSSTRREVTRATQTLAILERLAIDAAVHEDRISRLDAGTATENISLVDLPDTALAAVAKSIASPAPAPSCPPKRKRK